ncbi:MAG TPA: hypothetical protein PLK75_07345, partial [Bacteroidales bacterium]|nr:hypothetical protein [Bacteroidales bacterium]
CTSLRILVPETSASTNSATWAFQSGCKNNNFNDNQTVFFSEVKLIWHDIALFFVELLGKLKKTTNFATRLKN